MNGRNSRNPDSTKKIATPTSMRCNSACIHCGRCSCTHGRVANAAWTSSTIVIPKNRNASKHGKCSVGPASNPAAPISCDAPPVGLTSARRLRDFLVVLLFDVHRPDVVVGAEDVLHAEHRGVHRVVLVVVAVHAVATDRVHVGRVFARATSAASRRWPCTPSRRTGTPSACARRSRPRPWTRRPGRGARSSRLPCSTRSASDLVHISSPSCTKNSSPRQVRPSFTRYGDHELKFWMRPTSTSGSWM